MPEHPYMPVNTGRILADTAHLSAEEMGAYCRLLFTMWQQGAMLNDDQEEFARIAGIGRSRWRRQIAPRVMRFMTVASGLVSQKRLSATWLDVIEKRKKCADASAVAAAKRLKNHIPGSSDDASNGHLTKTKTRNEILSFFASSRRQMTPEEYTAFQQVNAPLWPHEVKQRGNR